MSKICGYSCEHNKNGICQISVCSKKSNMKDKTETELFRETWYEISQIRQLQQENKQLKDNWNKLKKDIGYELLKIREPNEYNEGLCNAFNYINNKMRELERGVSDDNH